jgi:hypothetical protein
MSDLTLRVRSILDSPPRPAPDYDRLKANVESGEGGDLEALINYLNFFEFMAALCQQGQLKLSEIGQMFDYYLRNLKSTPFVYD